MKKLLKNKAFITAIIEIAFILLTITFWYLIIKAVF